MLSRFSRLVFSAMAAAALQDSLVEVRSAVPDAVLDVRYATAANFLGRALYPFPAAYLRASSARKLAAAAETLRGRGYRLIVYDAYRPLSAQKQMWALKPDRRYVADPRRGSYHNRGAAVDVSLADLEGRPSAMPSRYDDFSERSRHGFSGGDPAASARRQELRRAMEGAGFKALEDEWWHYHDPAASAWPLLDVPFEELKK